jgi:hypothetical protein
MKLFFIERRVGRFALPRLSTFPPQAITISSWRPWFDAGDRVRGVESWSLDDLFESDFPTT